MKTRTAMLLAAAVAAGCALAPQTVGRPRGERHALARVPAAAHAAFDAVVEEPDAAAAGRKLFGLHCSQCHGADARGGRRGSDLLSGAVQQASAGDLYWVITNGSLRSGMPAWSHLPPARRWQLVAYLMTLAGGQEGEHPSH